MSDNTMVASGGPASLWPRVRTVALWAIQLYGAWVFLRAGWPKLAGAAWAVEFFGNLGLGQWFRYFTGGTEMLGGLLLLTPWASVFGALLLCCTMVGAIITHVFVIGGSALYPLTLLVLMGLVVAGRRGQVCAAAERLGIKQRLQALLGHWD